MRRSTFAATAAEKASKLLHSADAGSNRLVFALGGSAASLQTKGEGVDTEESTSVGSG